MVHPNGLSRPGRVLQLSNIYGPNGRMIIAKARSFTGTIPGRGWSNYTFSVTFNNSDDDGVGLMFRYQNPSNYYKVDLDSQRNFRKLFKMAGGMETTLATESGGYVVAEQLCSAG